MFMFNASMEIQCYELGAKLFIERIYNEHVNFEHFWPYLNCILGTLLNFHRLTVNFMNIESTLVIPQVVL